MSRKIQIQTLLDSILVRLPVSQGVVSVGLTVGDYVGNAATVVGSSIVEAAETTVDALPSEIKSAAQRGEVKGVLPGTHV